MNFLCAFYSVFEKNIVFLHPNSNLLINQTTNETHEITDLRCRNGPRSLCCLRRQQVRHHRIGTQPRGFRHNHQRETGEVVHPYQRQLRDVVLGYDNVAQYADSVNSPSDFGAAIGRYANRIKNGLMTIDGQTIQLPRNNFGHCLHGGPSGWQYQVYDANQPNDSTLVLTMMSPDGDNGFPGNVKADVTYVVRNNNSLDITYAAVTDKKTVVNMTNHSYFNLNGDANKTVENHVLHVNAYIYTPSDDTYMTTGDTAWVKGTPMDFMEPKEIGKDVNNFDYKPIKNANGFDHNWCLASYHDGKGNIKQLAASLYSPETGIMMEVFTNEPGIQVYTGNFLEGKVAGKGGIKYAKHAGVCLETQKYPDSPNKPKWPSPLLSPGEKYYSHCIYKFGVVK